MRIPHITLLLATVCLVTANDSHKRVPSGFTGVRGKKSIPDSEYGSLHDPQAQDKRAPAGFLGVRGKKPFDGWIDDIKRSPSAGFLGMRGKKESESDYYYKRAPNGFLGMRGKKEFNPFGTGDDETFEKRAPAGFLGMRGKKDDDLLIKRAPSSGFLGMRGKKQPARSGFFGMRGKKYPYEFRGKFVGVRGKKASDEEANRDYADLLQNVGNNLDINQLMLLLTENESYNNPDNFYPDYNIINN